MREPRLSPRAPHPHLQHDVVWKLDTSPSRALWSSPGKTQTVSVDAVALAYADARRWSSSWDSRERPAYNWGRLSEGNGVEMA